MFLRGIVFFLISISFSWGLFGILWGTGQFRNGLESSHLIYLFLFMFGPAIGAIITAFIFDRGNIKSLLGLKLKPSFWWLLALITPALIIGLATWLTQFFPETTLQEPSDAMRRLVEGKVSGELLEEKLETMPPFLVIALLTIISSGIINGILTLSEELGWRGYLWSIIRPIGFWKASLITGVLWGAWHAPIIIMGYNYPGEPVMGPLMMILFTTGLSPIMGWLRDQSSSVLTGSIFHGVINGLAPLSVSLIVTDNVFYNGIMGWPGIVVLGAVAICIVLLPKKEIQ